MMDEKEAQYVAGLIDARGTIQYYNDLVNVSLKMEGDMPRILHQRYGGSFIRIQSYRHRKVFGWWRIYGITAVRFLKEMLPYLRRNKEEAKDIIKRNEKREQSLELARMKGRKRHP